MSNVKPLDLIQPPTAPRANEADLQAQREWERTGLVPMAYVQDQLRQGFSSGQTIVDLVLASIGAFATGEAAPTSNRGK
jgi:hypothetical protein